MSIWIVEDEAFAAKLLVGQLARLGHPDARVFQDAREAIAVLDHDPAAAGLIFLDLQMPGMDGIEFIRALAQAGYRGRLALISGQDERVLQAASQIARFHLCRTPDVLSKPATTENLSRILRGSAEGRDAGDVADVPAELQAEELRAAIDSGRLVNYYEPKVDLRTARPVGVEALVRWEHPVQGLIMPKRFIPVAERHGLIDRLTQGVLRGALAQAQAWHVDGLDLNLSVNVSMHSLVRLDIPEFIAREAAAAGLPTSRLTLEITESQVMSHPETALDILARLRLKGIGLAIDDFGTGHSSLAQLRDVPFNELKIDRGFVHEAALHPSRQAIVEASVGLARRLGMLSVAEGVSDRTDWDFVRRLGCDQAQGHFLAPAMPPQELRDWLSDWQSRVGDLLT